jgi:ABC-type transporter Mla subunit MlaD
VNVRRKATGIMVLVVIAAAAIAGYWLYTVHSADRLTVVLPNAIGVMEGTPVQIDGFPRPCGA